jgi:hypothetical protein
MTRECLLGQQTTLGAKSSAIIVDTPQVSIDTIEDLELAEMLMIQRIEQQAKRNKPMHSLDDNQDTDAVANA